MGPAEALAALGTGERGLDQAEVGRRRARYGENRLPEPRPEPIVLVFLRQFASPLIYLLLAASGVVFLLGQETDGAVILAVLLFNAIVGTIQEGRSQRTLSALRQFATTSAAVVREGREHILPDTALVPGDIILLQEGERVPVDARLVEAHTLKLDESSLTGESAPVHKVVDIPAAVLARARSAAPAELATAEQRTMVFRGTYVLTGNGRAAAVATGLGTVIGKISQAIRSVDTEIPLKADVRRLSRLIVVSVLAIAGGLFLLGRAFGKSAVEMFTTAVALSVSIIPEGLPVVLTLVLATGVWRMSKRHALVKRLQAVETLGQARVIAVDKTGTLTRNEMVVREVFADGVGYEVTGSGYDPVGEFLERDSGRTPRPAAPAGRPGLLALARIASFCANARLSWLEEAKIWRLTGDPTEAALLVLGAKAGLPKAALEGRHPLVQEIPFDYQTKVHATVHAVDGTHFLSVVGAPEVVLAAAATMARASRTRALSAEDRAALDQVFRAMSGRGLRVLAAAYHPAVSGPVAADALPPLTFLGFYGMADALRPEAVAAIREAQAAGISVVMLSGDHRLTAEAVAREAGILTGGEVITGEELRRLGRAELEERVGRVAVFARVTPEDKMAVIQAYRRRGEIVAMTGDGVNDAPSLVAADLGVAMGRTGTEVAKEAADIVVLDDNLSSIVAAIEEGRSIYKTIKKVILYLFSTSVGEVLTIGGALAVGWPLPILPAQIIWLNFVTDGFLDVALAMEPKEAGLLSGSFERPKRYLVDRLMAVRMAVMALPMAGGALALFALNLGEPAKAWTMTLTTLAVFQWFNVWNCRSADRSVFRLNPFSNPFLVGATILIILLQFAAIYTVPLQKILHTVPLSLSDWFLIIPVAFSIVLAEETRKFIHRKWHQAA